MSSEHEQAGASSSPDGSRRLSGGGWALMLAGVLVAYPLSLAPVAFAYARCGEPPQMMQALTVFYKPLIWVRENVPVVGGLLGRWEMVGYELGGGEMRWHCGTK